MSLLALSLRPLGRPLEALCHLRPRPLAFLALRATRRAHSIAPSSVTVRATAAAAAERAAPASFGQLGITTDLQIALAEKGICEPTEIQATAVPALLHDQASDFILASHTGSGKTLAYLLPIVQLLKDAETAAGGPLAKPKRPRALVLGPTRELTDQILKVAKFLAHSAKFRSGLINGGGDMGTQREQLERSLDVLVGTPQRVMQHAEKSNLYYGDVEVVVLDEADTMFDRGFGPEVKAILAAVRNKAEPARCVLVSATMTKAVRGLIDEDFPAIRHLETSSLHRGVAGARHTFMPMPPQANKLDLLVQVIEGEHQRGKRVMVFCNTLASCRAADHFLTERGLDTACYHGDVPVEERKAAIQDFAASEDGGRPPLLVCTDLAARGLDIPGRVDHVVNFDFPLNPVDYLHRTGRTARAGATGRITSLVAKGDRVLAGRIEEALQRGLPLDALSSNRDELPAHMRPKPETLRRKALEKKAERHSNKGVRGAKRVERFGGSGPGGSSAPGSKSASGGSSGGYKGSSSSGSGSGSFGAARSGGSFGGSKSSGGYGGSKSGGSYGGSKTDGSFGDGNKDGGSFGDGRKGKGSFGPARSSGSFGDARKSKGSFGPARSSGSFGGSSKSEGSFGSGKSEGSFGGEGKSSGSFGGERKSKGSFGPARSSGSFGGSSKSGGSFGGERKSGGKFGAGGKSSGGSFGGESKSGGSFGGGSKSSGGSFGGGSKSSGGSFGGGSKSTFAGKSSTGSSDGYKGSSSRPAGGKPKQRQPRKYK